PYRSGVAAASTYGQRGVMTAVPKARSLGLTRCTRTRPSLVHERLRAAGAGTIETARGRRRSRRRARALRAPYPSLRREVNLKQTGAPGDVRPARGRGTRGRGRT